VFTLYNAKEYRAVGREHSQSSNHLSRSLANSDRTQMRTKWDFFDLKIRWQKEKARRIDGSEARHLALVLYLWMLLKMYVKCLSKKGSRSPPVEKPVRALQPPKSRHDSSGLKEEMARSTQHTMRQTTLIARPVDAPIPDFHDPVLYVYLGIVESFSLGRVCLFGANTIIK